MNIQSVIAGFGGQGILFAGKLLVYTGLLKDKQVSWLPSYGPEMRGGTANCSVVISDTPVGSPIVITPNLLVAMNLPSFDKFEQTVVAGGSIFIDSSLITKSSVRDDCKVFYIPATNLAIENAMPGLANMIIMGKMFKELGEFTMDDVKKALEKTVPASKTALIEKNLNAINLGYNYL